VTAATCRSNGLFSRAKSSSAAADRVRWKLYEEYHPYGTTAFRASSGASGFAPKRYRYTGKERDEETGLYYYGARYYPPWLARWTAVDPSLADGLNVYEYVRSNPIRFGDDDGGQALEMCYEKPKVPGIDVAVPPPPDRPVHYEGQTIGVTEPGGKTLAQLEQEEQLRDASG
jgi:RHS repeat-associated protein